MNVREALVELPVDVPLVLIRAPIAENTGLYRGKTGILQPQIMSSPRKTSVLSNKTSRGGRGRVIKKAPADNTRYPYHYGILVQEYLELAL